jgi:hypothetical protein
MDEKIAPKKIEDFIGNKTVVSSLRRWAEDIKNNIYHPKRICFLTGSISTGKSVLAKLILEEQGFVIREFISTDLRIKQHRELLYQTFCYKDVLAIINKKKEFRKAIIIDDFENMCLATQEVFRKVNDLIKKKKSIGIPIIFIGCKFFKGKRPLMGTSIYFRLFPRTDKDIYNIQKQILNIFLKENKDNKKFIELKNESKKQIQLCQKASGDVRKIIKYFEIISSNKNEENLLEMVKNERTGPLYSLNKIINYDNNCSIKNILNEILCESTLPYGIHTSYINYIPWIIKKNNINSQKERCSQLCSNISILFSIFGILKDYEKKHQMWDLTDIANVISCWGMRVFIKEEINKIYPDIKNKPSYTGKNFWWNELKKRKKTNDEPIDLTICSKNLRGHLNKHALNNTSFKMIKTNIANCRSWRPKQIRNTIQLLKLKKEYRSKENKEYQKIPDNIIKIVGVL